jgi:hypothetical protein
VFPTSTDITVTTRTVLDTTITFQANTYYTIIHQGYVNGTAVNKLIVIQDETPNAGSNVAVRAINVGLGLGNVDFFVSPTGGTSALPSSPTFSNVAFGAVTSYSTVAPGTLAVRATTAGTRSPILADNSAPAGLPADPSQGLNAVGGASQGGSALVAILTPRSVALSGAPQGGAFSSPAIVYIVDRNPK